MIETESFVCVFCSGAFSQVHRWLEILDIDDIGNSSRSQIGL